MASGEAGPAAILENAGRTRRGNRSGSNPFGASDSGLGVLRRETEGEPFAASRPSCSIPTATFMPRPRITGGPCSHLIHSVRRRTCSGHPSGPGRARIAKHDARDTMRGGDRLACCCVHPTVTPTRPGPLAYRLLPSTCVTSTDWGSKSSRQRRLIANISWPSPPLPCPHGRTPQVLQKR